MAEYTPQRVIYEIVEAGDGRSVRVSAFDEDTYVEARVVCPNTLDRTQLHENAFRKLKAIQNKKTKREAPTRNGNNDIIV